MKHEDLRAAHGRMRAAARRMRLSFRNKTWRGRSGNWQGAGVGSSIDFQDHRPYLPGDDPRHIDWQAYARTGHYTMKLYREEVSPRVDLALDVSASMFFDGEKLRRSLELFYFCVESALMTGASLRCHAISGHDAVPWPIESVLAYEPIEETPSASPPRIHRVPWRRGTLRVLISDLLFAGSPEPHLAAFAASQGWGVIFIPHCTAETAPPYRGNVEMTECETSGKTILHVTTDLVARYNESYARHFDLWKTSARKYSVITARVPSENEFLAALQSEALPEGAVELLK